MSRSLPSPLTELPWDRPEPPTTASVAERLRDAGVEPTAWSNGPGDRYGVHEHSYTKLLVCAAGSITFLIGPDAVPVALVPGDGGACRLHLSRRAQLSGRRYPARSPASRASTSKRLPR